MLTNNLALINKETGEIIEDNIVIFGKKPYFDKGYIKVFVAFLKDIVENKKISGKAIRLLMYAIEKVNWNSLKVYLHEKEVCKNLKIGRATYYRWLEILLKEGYLYKTDMPHLYELRPYVAVRGSMKKIIQNQIHEVKNVAV